MSTRTDEFVATAGIAPCLLGLIGAACSFVLECLFWLKNGRLPGWSLKSQLDLGAADTGWVGVDKVLDWFFNLQLSGSLAAASVIGLVIFCSMLTILWEK